MITRSQRRLTALLALAALLLLLGAPSRFAEAAEPDLQDGDLFVGAISENDGWGESGAIKRVRGGSVSTYCESPFSGEDKWKTPHDVLVDSQGRVVFLAEIGPLSYTHGVYGLLRCSGAGSTAEKLAVFGVGGELVPVVGSEWRGYPVPFPDLTIVGNVGGLHLARKTEIVIDDDIAGGKPKTVKEDTYELVISTPSEFKSVRYRPATGEWEDGARIVRAQRYVWSGFIPDATYYGGATYSTLENVLGRDREPFRIDVKGKIFGFSFGLRLGLFGGYTEVGGQDDGSTNDILDDVLIPNQDGGCPPGAISTAVPRNTGGNYNPPAGFGEVAKHRLFGLVVTSNSAAASAPFLTQFGGVLLDDNPLNDGDASFLRPELGCTVQRKLEFEPILPFWDLSPPAGAPADNGVTRLASGTEGLFGTQLFNGRVVRIQPGERLATIASGLIRPAGIAAYPANVPPGLNVAIVIRIDSPVNVLVTAADGKRIGVDASGTVVNDFGPFGYVGETGEPRFMAIRDPAPGTFSVDAVGTGTGPYAVHVYSIDTDELLGEHVVARGTASPGSTSDHDFTLAADGTVAFVSTGQAPTLQSAASRKVHGVAGTFDLPLAATPLNPTTEPRSGPAHTLVFTFDDAVTAGTATVTEGTATVGVPTFSGNEMIVPLSGVTNAQYVTVAVSNVTSVSGSSSGSIRLGFLAGDVNQNRVVTLSDLGQVNAQIAQFVTSGNYLEDVNASGTLSLADKGIVNTQITKALPAP